MTREIDVRAEASARRHRLTFETCAPLAPDNAFVRVNDHNVKRLDDRLAAGHATESTREPQHSPPMWRVQVGRTGADSEGGRVVIGLATDRPDPPEPALGKVPVAVEARRPTVSPIVVYGDFNCPWSYLAFRRAAVLEGGGVQVDWRAVEHDPSTPARRAEPSARFAALPGEMDRVLAMLIPGERLPYDLRGFVPSTDAAVAAYAENYVAQVSALARRVLFEAYWMHGIDIGSACVLRTLLVDELPDVRSPSEAMRDGGYPVAVDGGTISTRARRLIARWAAQWQETGKQVVPAVQLPDSLVLHGVEAVEWLADQIVGRGLDPDLPDDPGLDRTDSLEPRRSLGLR